MERLELQLGHGDGRVESGGINRGQVQLLGAVAVVGHVHRGLEQGLGVDQPDGLVVLSIGELFAVDDQGEVQAGEGKLVLGGVQLEADLQQTRNGGFRAPSERDVLGGAVAGPIDDPGGLRDVVQDMGWLAGSILIGDVQLQGHLGQHAGLIGGGIGVGPAAYLGLRHRRWLRRLSSASC